MIVRSFTLSKQDMNRIIELKFKYGASSNSEVVRRAIYDVFCREIDEKQKEVKE